MVGSFTLGVMIQIYRIGRHDALTSPPDPKGDYERPFLALIHSSFWTDLVAVLSLQNLA